MDKVTTLIFDLDNTLIDRQKAALACIRDIILEDFPQRDFSDAFRDELLREWYVWDDHGHRAKKEVYSNYIAYTGIKGRTWEHYDALWTQRLWSYTTLADQVVEVLETLKQRYTLALLTNGSVFSQENKLRQSNLKGYFKEVVISGAYGIHKPDPRIFKILCDKLQVSFNRCLYIGDGIINDVQGSLAVGMRAIWVYPDPAMTTDLPCQRIYQLKDLKQCL